MFWSFSWFILRHLKTFGSAENRIIYLGEARKGVRKNCHDEQKVQLNFISLRRTTFSWRPCLEILS